MKPVRQTLPAGSRLLLGALVLALISGCSRVKSMFRPAAVSSISAPIPGEPAFNGGQFPLAPLGYQREEFFFSGDAASYKPSAPLLADGRWTVAPVPDQSAPFTSRMVVIRPTDPLHFNGTVVVEWLNVTSGGDQPAEWIYAHRELLREGYAYVAVSAQRTGVEGGAAYFGGGKSLKQLNPQRYAKLHHPGDAYSYDIFSQAGRLVRTHAADILGPLKPLRLIAAGESQSAIFLTTYVNAVDPLAKVFDGFLIHSRFGFASGIGGALDGAPERGQPKGSPVQIRTDVRVPVLLTITETDVLAPTSNFLRARQPDSDRIRTWEIAGTAHADNYVFGLGGLDSGALPIAQLAAGFRPIDTVAGRKLPAPINAAPQHHYVEQAALHSLNRWLKTGAPPASAPVLQVTSDASPAFVLDANGNVRGGVRSPWVDAPTSTYSGLGQPGGGLLALLGTTKPFAARRLHALYPRGKAEYLARFQTALQSAVKDGFLLDADQQEIQSLAAESWPGSTK